MKATVILTALLFVFFLCKAQITMQPLVPETGAFQKNQLWNVLVVNNNPNTINGYIVLDLQNRETGVDVLSATSTDFSVDKGAKQLNAAALTPIQYSYFSFTGSSTEDFLPVGSYNVCYKLITGENAILAEACVPFDVTPLSPPILITPADSSILQVQPAMFTWQPPAPLVMFQQLHYELVIAEILPGQQPQEAIELNAPVYTDLNVQSNVMNYSNAYPSFEIGKWYAWQVVARDGNNYAEKTDVWCFKLDANDSSIHPLNGNYILMSKDDNHSTGVHVILNNVLGLKYYSYQQPYQAIIRLYGSGKKLVKEVTQQIVYGENFLTYQLDNNFQKGVVYQVEIIEKNNNKTTAFFELK